MGPAGWPFGPGFDLNDLMRMLQTPGPVNWELATRVAEETSLTDPDTQQHVSETPLDATAHAQLADLARAAQSHIADATGLAEVLALAVDIVDRREWARRTLEGLRPVLEALAETLALPAAGTGTGTGADPEAELAPFEGFGPDMFAAMMPSLAPVFLGWMAGALCGLLAQLALGQYDLPLPLDGPPRLAFVGSNIATFEHDWSLPSDDLRFALALREVVHGAQRVVPWVRERLVRLSSSYVRGYELRADALQDLFGGAFADIDPTDPSSFEDLSLPEPSALLDAMKTPAQQPVLEELQQLAAVLEGYADVVVDTVGGRLVPSLDRIEEALRRHRVDRGRAADFVDRMLGLELGRDHYDRGYAFCAGVVERAGMEGLDRLWEAESMLPTPNEFVAPGLWLARIELETS